MLAIIIFACFTCVLTARVTPRNFQGMINKGAASLDLGQGDNMGVGTVTTTMTGLFTRFVEEFLSLTYNGMEGIASLTYHGMEEIASLTYHGMEEIVSFGLAQPASYFYEKGVRTSRKLKNIVRDYRGEYAGLLDEAISLSESYLDPTSKVVWRRTKGSSGEDCEGVDAWVAKTAIPTSSEPDGDIQWPVIKASTILRGIAPKELSGLLMDSTRVSEYNEFAVKRVDVEVLKSPVRNVEEKVIYVQTRNPFKLKPYDMVSLMRSAPSLKAKGGMIIITKGCEHAKAPLNPAYRRSSVVVAVNECLPYREKGKVIGTRITTITQSRYIGIPKLFLNKMNTAGTLTYLSNLRKFTDARKQ